MPGLEQTDKRESLRPHTQALMQKLEMIERETSGHTHTGHARWMIPYADLLTLLLGFFVVLFAMAKTELKGISEVRLQNPLHPVPASAPVHNGIKDSRQLSITTTGAHQESKAMQHNEDARLQKELQGLLSPGIAISRQERGVVISLKDSILFTPGSADLTPAARKTIDQLADRLATGMQGDPRPIRVEGHTDNTPIHTSKYPSNWELSTARATTIVKYLVDRHHFAPPQLSAAGYGEFKPIAENSSIEGKQKNRRVDIVVLNRTAAQSEPAAPDEGSQANPGE